MRVPVRTCLFSLAALTVLSSADTAAEDAPRWHAAHHRVLEAGSRASARGPDDWYPHVLQRAPAKRLPGPFRCDGTAFFFVHYGGPLELEVEVSRRMLVPEVRAIAKPHAAFWQFYDADEHLVDNGFYRFEANGLRTKTFRTGIESGPPGIYQLRCALSSRHMLVDVKTSPATSFGFLPCRSHLNKGTAGQFETTYVYIPPGTETFSFKTYAAHATLKNEAGTELFSTGKTGVVRTADLTSGEVCELNLKLPGTHSYVGAGGLPAILCPDPVTARNIRGSIEFAPDGTRLHHKFQLRYWEWMHSRDPRDFAVETVSLKKNEETWREEPRNLGLLGRSGPLKHVPYILEHQDLDPRSKNFGKGVNASFLAAAYGADATANPYYQHKGIRNRLLLYEFATYLDLHENGTFQMPDYNHYPGVDGLRYDQQPFAFAYAGRLLDSELRTLWFEGVSKPANRWPFARASCENQTTFFLAGLYYLHMGSGREIYKELAHNFAVGLCDPHYNPFLRTGYQREKSGPDATYNGLAACNQAAYYNFSGDELTKDALQRVYRLFNHTVAPEPDGTRYGASNFSHRTAGSWVHRQWRGGTNMMADETLEAAVWHQDIRDRQAHAAKRRKLISRVLDDNWDDPWYERNLRWVNRYALMPWTEFFNQYLFPPETIPEAKLPVLRKPEFTWNANDEFYFFRQRGYYAFVYTGATGIPNQKRTTKPVAYSAKWKRTDEGLEGKKDMWYPTQGLSMFWTPEFGSSLLAKNWNIYTSQTVRAELHDGSVSWPAYWTLNHEYDAEERHITMRQKMLNLPVHVTRDLRFGKNGVRQQVALRVDDDGSPPVKTLYEQLPFLAKKDLRMRFRSRGKWHNDMPATCDGLWLGNDNGAGVLIAFDAGYPLVKSVPSHCGHNMTGFGVKLADSLQAGETLKVSYRITPARRNELDQGR